MVGGAGMSCHSRCTRPANGSGRRGSTPCRRRLSAGRKLDTSLWKDVIAGLPPGNDSYALIPLDQPARPAQLIADFTPAPGSSHYDHPQLCAAP